LHTRESELEKKKSFAQRCLKEKRRPIAGTYKVEEKRILFADPGPELSEPEGEMENRRRCRRMCREGKFGVLCWEVTEKRR
jgi:hypothetical protein